MLQTSFIKEYVKKLNRESGNTAHAESYKLVNMHGKAGREAHVLDFFKHGTDKLPNEKDIALL